MIESLLVVLSNAVAGRDDDFNDWYTHIHLRDALSYRGSVAAQRFRFRPEQVQDFPEGFVARYLALYEVTDSVRFSQEHFDNVLTPRMVIGDSFDLSWVQDYYYYFLVHRNKTLRPPGPTGVLMEQIRVEPDKFSLFETWYLDNYFSETFSRHGVTAASILRFDPHGQLMGGTPTHTHLGLYYFDDPDVCGVWRKSMLTQCPHVDRGTLAITCWDTIIPRLTSDSVKHPTSAALAAEEAARARVGDHIHRVRGALRD